MYVTVAA